MKLCKINKLFSYSFFLVLFLFFIALMGFGSVLVYHYEGGVKYKLLRKTVKIISSVPQNFKLIIEDPKSFLDKFDPNIDKPPNLTKHIDKKKFNRLNKNKNRNALLVLPRYDPSLSRSVVDVIDLVNFKVIHTYKHDIDELNKRVKNIEEFPRIEIDDAPIRFLYKHPLILDDGSLVSDSNYSVAFKIDICSNLKWVNDEEVFHHSKELDHNQNIWIGGQMHPKSKYIKKRWGREFSDDSAILINKEGEILYNKSISELLIENKLLDNNIFELGLDPIHLNDIEPALSSTSYWEKGDIFLSSRHLSAVIHYRPNSNKVINYIIGPFSQQHDVDIISDKEISIFNNNNFFDNNNHSEILIYNFETKEFRKLFNNELKKENFHTETGGLSHLFKDGSLMVEETNHGRIILFDNKGNKEFELVNKDKNGDIGFISWFRIIEDQIFIEKFKSLIENKKCLS